MAPYEALYGRPCISPMYWMESGEASMIGPELVAPLDLNLSIALNADTTQLNRVIATQARKKSL